MGLSIDTIRHAESIDIRLTGNAQVPDDKHFVILDSETAKIVTLPPHDAGKIIRFTSNNKGVWTLLPQEGAIGGCTTMTLCEHESIILYSNGGNWGTSPYW